MTCKNILVALLVVILANSIYATGIIYTKKDDVGPGIVSIDISSMPMIPYTDVVVPIVPIISSSSQIYYHDGKAYIKGESKGSFSLSGYCACTKCGTGTGITASGKPVRANHTISADTKVLPMGTVIILENAVGKDGQVYDGVYVVEDRGGGVKNNHIDIYRPTHDLASLVTHFGKLYGDVYIAEEYDVGNTSS